MEWDKMTEKRFVDGGEECIEDQFLIDTSNDKYYWVSDGLDDIVKLLNDLYEENMEIKCKSQMVYERYAYKKLYDELKQENEQLKQFKDKVYRVINARINVLENDYNKAVKAGMPSNSVYGEIELLEDLKKELGK